MLFVVTGSTFGSHCLHSMLDFDVICNVSEHLFILLVAFDVCLILMLFVVSGTIFGSESFFVRWLVLILFFVVGSTFDSYAFLRCVVLILVVVAGGIFGSHCLHSMLDRLLGCCRILVSTVIHWELMTYSEFFREPTSSTRRLSLSRLGAGEGYALSFNSKRQPYSRNRVFKLIS